MQNARRGALILVLLSAVYLCCLMLRPFLDVLLWAAVLATVFYPVHRRIKMRTGPGLAAAICSASSSSPSCSPSRSSRWP